MQNVKSKKKVLARNLDPATSPLSPTLSPHGGEREWVPAGRPDCLRGKRERPTASRKPAPSPRLRGEGWGEGLFGFFILHFAFCIFLLSFPAAAQDPDLVSHARALARAGDRAEALALLEARLAEAPEDRDARTLYGTVLSWETRYDDARRELRRVVAEDPASLDARLALIRVEIWSGNRNSAAELIEESLARFPGDPELLALRAQIRGNPPAREVRAGIALDEPEPGEAWREVFASVALPTRYGPVIPRAGRAERGADEGLEISVEAYPRINPKTYAWIQAAVSDDSTVYPDWRFGAELYQTFGTFWEGSLGYRRLEFDDGVDLVTASLGRYVGSWLVVSRVYVSDADTSVQLAARRYSGDGRQFIGVRAARGSAREQIRTDIDLAAFDSTELALESRFVFGERWLGDVIVGYGNGEDGAPDRVYGMVAVGVRF
jgi:YaiO family outer membrane protein